MAEDLTAKTISGVTWSAIGAAGEQAISSIATLILVRLLTPGAYGLLAMATVCAALFASLKDLGTYSAVIRSKQLSERMLSSIFWLNLVWGLIGAGALVAIAPLAAIFYREPHVFPVLAVLSLSFLFSSLGLVQRALLARAMSFRKLAFIQMVSALVGVAVGIAMAVRHATVWSLVFAILTNAAAEAVLLWMVSSWRPAWQWDSSELRAIKSYCLHLTGTNFLDYVDRNADNLLIGRYLGATPLGYYSVSYNLMMYPLQLISWALGRVLFPAFSQLGDDNARFRQSYLRVCAIIATITFPLMLGMIATADVLVVTLFGAKWTPIVPLVMILAPVGMLQSVSSTTGMIYLVKGRSDWQLRWSIFEDVLVVCSFLVGLRWGVLGVAAAYASVSVVLRFPAFAVPFRLIELSMRDLAAAVWPALRSALVMCGTVLFLREGLQRLSFRPGAVLAITVATGVVVYVSLLTWQRPPAFQDMVNILHLDRLRWLRRAVVGSRPD